MMRTIFILLFSGFLSLGLSAQEEKPVQMSGLVLSQDSIPRPIPFAHVYVGQGTRGTMTDADGFFSFAALAGDSIRFSCIGFTQEVLVVPDTLSKTAYLARVMMKRDTTLLEEVTLYPWPTPDRFKEAFLATNIPTTQNDIAMRNLAIQALQDRAAAMNLDPEEAKDLAIMMQNQSIYDYGRYQGYDNGATAILGALSNPFAWQRLFQSFKKN
ncbi:carboxypeptidase-like regulatory domain-containing protein [Croceimicrobium sp.]|uniref:carboxypeptidase-like regulatory domain-containing protein n=1 Tax=Croceimicrobium sp. TaxID=2828340 RepID=UPI003BA8C9B9